MLTRSGLGRSGHGGSFILGLEYVELMKGLDPLLGFLVGDVGGKLRLYGPRLHHRHPDLVLDQLLPQGLGDGVDGELRPRVDAAPRTRLAACDAGYVDDVPAPDIPIRTVADAGHFRVRTTRVQIPRLTDYYVRVMVAEFVRSGRRPEPRRRPVFRGIYSAAASLGAGE